MQFGYDLPDDKFRQPYQARRVRLTFEAEHVPALGHRTDAWVRKTENGTASSAVAAGSESISLLRGDRALENELIRVEIAKDGSL